MPELLADCPRCGAKSVTFSVVGWRYVATQLGWQQIFDTFCCCRHCSRTVVFTIRLNDRISRALYANGGLNNATTTLNKDFSVIGYLSIKDVAQQQPPEYLPPEIEAAFKEGATCIAVNCFNAGATMFRLCIDHATRPLVPEKNNGGPDANVKRSLGLRLKWLFDNGKLPETFKELSHCIKEDGNDGAHAGTLTKEDADDLLDFTKVLLERLYTEPKELELAKVRREERRKKRP